MSRPCCCSRYSRNAAPQSDRACGGALNGWYSKAFDALARVSQVTSYACPHQVRLPTPASLALAQPDRDGVVHIAHSDTPPTAPPVLVPWHEGDSELVAAAFRNSIARGVA